MSTLTANQGLLLPATGDGDNVPQAFSDYNSGVETRLVMKFDSATDRTARYPFPAEGDLCWLRSTKVYEKYVGGTWTALIPTLGARDASYTTAGALVSTTGTEVAMTAWNQQDTAFTFKAGRMYALRSQLVVYNDGANMSVIERTVIRVRKAVNSIVAQQLSTVVAVTFGGSLANGSVNVHWSSYVANNTGADITGVHLGLTAQRQSGANANHIYGDATFPAIVVLEDVGLVSDNPGLLGIATQIT